MLLPSQNPIISCLIKIHSGSTFLVLAYPGCPGKEAIKWMFTAHTRLTALCPGLPRWAGTRKVKPIWILLEQETERQWYQLGHMQVCTLLQTVNHASTSLLKFFTGRMPFLPPNQQCQSTESNGCLPILNKLSCHALHTEMGAEPATSLAGWWDSTERQWHDWEWGCDIEWSTVGWSSGQGALWSFTVWTGSFLSWGITWFSFAAHLL